MYTEFLQDMYRGDRTKIRLTSVGRSEFRKNVAKAVVSIGVLLMVMMGVAIQFANLNTANWNYSAQVANTRANNTMHHGNTTTSR